MYTIKAYHIGHLLWFTKKSCYRKAEYSRGFTKVNEYFFFVALYFSFKDGPFHFKSHLILSILSFRPH